MSTIHRLLPAFIWLIPGCLTISSQGNVLSEDFGNALPVEKTAVDMAQLQIEEWNTYLKQHTRVGQKIGEIDLMMKAFGAVGMNLYFGGGTGDYLRVYPIDEFVEIWVYCNDRRRAIIEIPFATKNRHWRRFPDGSGYSDNVFEKESKPSGS
jgi:hypothetical protein